MKPRAKRFILGWLDYGGGLVLLVLILDQLAFGMPVLAIPGIVILFARAIDGYCLIQNIHKI